MSNETSNKFKYLVMKGDIAPLADTFKIILMQSGFVFTPTYDTYADVSASELPTASGYTVGGNTLAGVTLTEDDVNHKAVLSWSNSSWSISGGNIVTRGAIVFDDTVASPADPIVCYIDFGSDQTVLAGGTATVAGIKINLIRVV